MASRVRPLICCAALLLTPLASHSLAAPLPSQGRITILDDAFGKNPALGPDWGYSALIEFQGKRILFDTGGSAALYPKNLARLHVDLSHLDLLIVSHAHADHTSGLRYVLSLNPNVSICVPDDPFFTGKEVPQGFMTTDAAPTLPTEMRYFGGKPPAHIKDWQSFNDTRMTVITGPTTIAPHIRLVALTSARPAFLGLREISLILDSPKGPIVIAGCSHPGIEAIMAEATANSTTPVYMLFGGLHMVEDTRDQIAATLTLLADRYHVQKMAVGHCTGELAFLMIQQKWGKNDEYAGLGETINF